MWKFCCACMALALFWGTQAQAHFGMVIPSTPTITDKKESPLKLDIAFAHPMELQGMPMAEPKAFTVTHDGAAEDLKSLLKPSTIMGNKAWTASYAIKKPGVYQFAVEPQPYFEPAEDCYIIHYTKTVVAAFGEEEGWGQPLGLKTEIVPLTRPFANYSGNVFQGQVLLDGKPVPGAEIEIESYNKGKGHTPPNEFYVTQVVKADQNGVFTYGVPWAGWWGFAALNTAEEKMDHQGEAKSVELGAVLWVNFAAPRVK